MPPMSWASPPGPARRGVPVPGDGGVASPGRRALGWLIDALVTAGLAIAIGTATYTRLQSLLTGGLLWRFVRSTAELLFFGGGVAHAAEQFGWSVWDSAILDVEEAFAALVVAEFVYHFTALAWKGRTLGKAVAAVRVQPLPGTVPLPITPTAGQNVMARLWASIKEGSGLGKGRSARRAAITAITNSGLYAVACILLLEGQPIVGVLCWLIAVVAFWGNAFPLLGRRRRTLSDRVAGTVVVRTLLYQNAVNNARLGAQAAVGGARAGAQVAVGGAQAAAQAARGGLIRAAEHPRIQQALTSDTARRAQKFGNNVGDKIGNAYRKQRDLRQQPVAPTDPPPPMNHPYLPPVQPPDAPTEGQPPA